MFKPGDIIDITMSEDGGETVYHNNRVVDVDGALLTVDQHGRITVYNMHSYNFVKAEAQKK
jgi:hypothetical protein